MRITYVRGYTKRDGTRVRPHIRRLPDTSESDTITVSIGAIVTTIAIVLTIVIGVWSGVGTSLLGGIGSRTPKAEIQAKNNKDFNHAKTRWQNNGYHVDFRAQDDEDCAAHSYGKVHDFFRSNSCELLSRAVFELRDKHQNLVLIAISRVNMPSTGEASELKTLVDTSGTGNVTELSRESGSYRTIRYTGKLYTSSLSGSTVQNTQVQPVAWAPAKVIMDEILKEAPALH